MPKRSNDFQHVVFLLQRQLVQHGFSVTEADMVAGGTGRKREVDITIKGSVGGHPVFFAVECRDHHRKPDVKWIDELIGKYQHVPADKVIAVSRTGFSRDALELAKSNRAPRIETLSLTDALETNWDAYFADLQYVTIDLLVPLDDPCLNVTVMVSPDVPDIVEVELDPSALRVVKPRASNGPTLHEVLNMIHRNADAQNLLRPYAKVGAVTKIQFDIGFPEGTRLVEEAVSLPLGQLSFEQQFRRVQRDVPLEHGAYAGAHVAGAVVEDYFGGRAHIALVQAEPDLLRFTMSLDENVRGLGQLHVEVHRTNYTAARFKLMPDDSDPAG